MDESRAPLCRMARAEDRDRLHTIWADTFGDDESFIGWLFEERFAPSFCPMVTVGGDVAACAHTLPGTIRVRDALLPCAILGGVATLPDYRKQGMMHRLIGYMMRELRARGIALVPHRPSRLETFFSLGHYPVCDMQYAERDPAYPGAAGELVRSGGWERDGSDMYGCYLALSRRYSGILYRSYADFQLKFHDHEASGGRILVYEDEFGVRGYGVYMDTEDGLLMDECAAEDDGVYQALFDALAALRPGERFAMRLPPDVRIAGGAICRTAPRAVLGVADAAALLRATGLHGGAVRLSDQVVPENNGIFTLDGEPTAERPGVELSAGRLAQWAVGYRSIKELAAEGSAAIIDAATAEYMDSVGKRTCYIIDEY